MRRAVHLTAAVLLALVVAGCGHTSPPPAGGGEVSVSPPASSDTVTIAPVALRIPAIGLDSRKLTAKPFLPLGLVPADKANSRQPAGSMETTDVHDPTRFGWYCPDGMPRCGAPYPGQSGGAVIGSHVNGDGKPGGLYKLAKVTGTSNKPTVNVHPGDTIEVDLTDQSTQVFRVTQVLTPDKTAFPTAKVFPTSAKPQLSVITCGGDFDRAARSYKQQIIVIADWVSARGH